MSEDNLSVTVNGRDLGLAQLLRTLDALGKQVDQSLTQAGQRIGQAIGGGAGRARPAVDQLGQATLRASRDSLSLAQTYARGQAAAGDYAGAIARLSSAMNAQSVVSVRQAAQIQNQIQAYERAAQAARDKAQAEAQGAGVMGQLTGIAGQLGVALALPAAAAGAAQLARQGATADLVRVRFEQLATTAGTTGQALLSALRAASGGEIADLNLQLAANRAQMLGVADSAEELATLMAIARDRAQSLGTDSATAFDDLVTGLGRGSPLILDNLGILVKVGEANDAYAASLGKTASQLTAAEQKQALINAVLEQGRASLAATGGAADSTAGSIAKFDAAVANLTNKLGAGLAGAAAPTLDLLSSFTNAFDFSRESILAFADAANVYIGATGKTAEANRGMIESALNFLGVQSAIPPVMSEASDATAAHAATAQALLEALQSGRIGVEQYAAGMQQLARTSEEARSGQESAANLTQIYGEQARLADERAQGAATATRDLVSAMGGIGPNAGGIFAAAGGLDAVAQAAREAAGETARLLGLLGGVNDERGSIGGTNTAAGANGLAGFGAGAAGAARRQADQARLLSLVSDPAPPRRRGGGGGRVSEQQREQDQLLKAQQDYQRQSLDAEQQYQDDLADIARDGAEARRKAEDSYRLGQARGRQGFYAGLADIDDNALRQQLSARYEQAAQEAAQIAQQQGADAAQAYLEASQRAIEAQGQLQEEIAAAEAEGDAGKAEYYRGLLALQQAADAEELRQIQAQGSQVAAAEAQQYADAEARYIEHLDRMGEAYDRKFGNAPPGLAPPPPASAGAGSTTGTAAPAASGAPAGAATGAGATTLVAAPDVVSAVDAGLGRVEAAVSGLGEGLAAVERRVGAVESAVRGLRNSGVVGG